MGGAVLQALVERQVVVAVPLSVYPALHLYVEVEPVVPVILETVPNAGLDNGAVHGFAAIPISWLVRAFPHLHMEIR